MHQLTIEQTTEYLKKAIELESSIFRQEKALKTLKQEIGNKKPEKKVAIEPYKHTPCEPIEPTIHVAMKTEKYMCIVAAVIFLAVGIGCLIGFTTEMDSVGAGMGFFFLLAATAAGFYFYGMNIYKKEENRCNKLNEQARLKYEDDKKQYEKDIIAYEKQYEQELKKYKNDLVSYENDFMLKSKKYQKSCEALTVVKEPLAKTKDTLKQFYDLDVIFPKYRNLIAMCTMYEYFASGRVSELTGPDGAYNLYESELRLNLIVNKMDVIITNLEQIRENQFTLYNEMKSANETISQIRRGIDEIATSAKEISESSKITAYCSGITAKNTEAIKFISLINR